MEEYLIIDPLYVQVFLTLVLLTYSIVSIWFFRKYVNQNLRDFRWIRNLNYLFLGFALSWALYYILFFADILTEEQDYMITGFMVLMVFTQSYLVYRKPEVLIDWNKIKKTTVHFLKYKKTGMSDELSLEFKDKLLDIMRDEKPYLNPELRLDDLSKLVGISRHHMSQVINQHFNKSFFDFINEYRIDEAKRILRNRQNNKSVLTIEIIYKVGFSNKASFYKAFKKFVGTSPGDFADDGLKAV